MIKGLSRGPRRKCHRLSFLFRGGGLEHEFIFESGCYLRRTSHNPSPSLSLHDLGSWHQSSTQDPGPMTSDLRPGSRAIHTPDPLNDLE